MRRSRNSYIPAPRAPFGRPWAPAGADGGAGPPFLGWAFAAAGGLAAGAFCVVPCSFAMVSALVDRFAAPLADAELAAVREHLDPAPRRSVAPAADDEDVGERQRALALDDAALPQLLRRPLVLLHHVELFHQHPAGDGQDPQHLAALAPLLAGDDPGVAERGVTLVGSAHHPDALDLLGSGVVGDVEHRARLDHRSGHVAQNLPDPPALLLGDRPGLLDEDPIADPTLVVLVVRLELLRHPDDALVPGMAEHSLDPHHPRLLHRVGHHHAFSALPLTHGIRPSARGARCWPAPDLSAPGSAATGSWPSPSRAETED